MGFGADNSNERLISSMTEKTWGCLGAGSTREPSLEPALTSSEKGIRNFTDAASQTQYRTEARLSFRASVSSHAAKTQNVDCQRCASRGDKSAWIIVVPPFSRSFAEPFRPP